MADARIAGRPNMNIERAALSRLFIGGQRLTTRRRQDELDKQALRSSANDRNTLKYRSGPGFSEAPR